MPDSITLWRNGDFLKLWTGQTVSELGSRITREGLPLAALLLLHATPAQMGLLSGLSGLSVLLFGLSAGVWSDRLRKRPILIATDLGRATLLACVPLAAAGHVLSMPGLYVIAALTGILTVFFDVAYQAYLPLLVTTDQLVEGNTKLMFSSTAAEIAGPGITGVLVQSITAPVAILLDAISFLFSACMVFLIRKPEPDPPPRPAQTESLWTETMAGLDFIAREPVLFRLAARAVSAYFFYGFISSLYLLYAIDILKLTPAALGFTIAVGGIGGTLGAYFSSRVVRLLGLGWTFVLSALVHGATASLTPLAHGPAPFAVTMLMCGQLFGDFAFAVYMINEISLRQRIAPTALLGRVNAAMQLATRGVLPLGALIGGFLAQTIGVRPVLAIAAAGVLLSTGWLLDARLLKVQET